MVSGVLISLPYLMVSYLRPTPRRRPLFQVPHQSLLPPSMEFTGGFAKLVPYNHAAQMLFSRTYIYVEKKDTFHLKFMEQTGREALPTSDEPVESSTDFDSQPTDEEGSGVESLQHR